MLPSSMSNRIKITHYPIFEKDIFKRNPNLFTPFFRNTPQYRKKRYEQRQGALSEYEESTTWPLVMGPGFCGATHPGAGKTFHGVMTGSNLPLYDSDGLYVNPARHVFGISDSPGATTFSRTLFENFDRRLKTKSDADIATLVNQLNRRTQPDERATLALIYFEHNSSEKSSRKAYALIAGDTCIFQGNIHHHGMVRIQGHDSFFGRLQSPLDPIEITLSTGDFFIIASDGIAAVRPLDQEVGVEEILVNFMKDDMNNFIFNIAQHCNRIIEDETPDQPRAWFRGNDDISLLFVYPDEFTDMDAARSVVLGGYVKGAILSRVRA